jgi:hypothetical protein
MCRILRSGERVAIVLSASALLKDRFLFSVLHYQHSYLAGTAHTSAWIRRHIVEVEKWPLSSSLFSTRVA